MSWIWWVAIILGVAMLVIDWIIVMGADPRRWKGRKDK